MSDPNPQMMFMFPCGPWHDWFAWFPVRTYDHRWVWLRSIRRRRLQTHNHLPGPTFFNWQYHNERHVDDEFLPAPSKGGET